MSCLYLNAVLSDGHCFPFGGKCPNNNTCFLYEESETEDQPVKETSNNVTTNYCHYCFNARVAEQDDEFPLTDDNDGSSISIGHCHDKTRRFMINSGMGKPVNIEFELWDNKAEQWYTVGRYYPKYCPECGRRLDEYEH